MAANYRITVEFGKKIIREINELYDTGNKMGYQLFLVGTGPFLLEVRSGSGHNYSVVMDCFHEFYAENPNVPIPQRLYEALEFYCGHVFNLKSANIAFSYILSQLEREKKSETAFLMDNQKLLDVLNMMIRQNKLNADAEFRGWLERSNAYLEKKLGMRMEM